MSTSLNVVRWLGFLFGIWIPISGLIGMLLGGTFKADCPFVEGRKCNDRGTCYNGVCECTDPFFSGPDCATTLSNGYLVAQNLVCNGRGFLGSVIMTKEDLLDVCNEKSSSFFRYDGWSNEGCIRETANKIKRIQLTSPIEAYNDVFQIPKCVCRIPYSGEACEIEYCPRNVGSGKICSGNGNKTVTRGYNGTSDGDGCQCNQDIIYLLDPAILNRYDSESIAKLKNSSIDLSQPFCGKLIEHPTIPRLKIIWQEEYQYSCHCNEYSGGEVCENRCPTNAREEICSLNGHPKLGQGAEPNSTIKFAANSEPICAHPFYLCGTECRSNKETCGRVAICPADRPIRCRSGLCVEKPLFDVGSGLRTYGIWENPNTLIANKRCFGSIALDSLLFEDDFDYNRSLSDCMGDEGTIQDNKFLFPAGKRLLETSLVALEIISVSNETDFSAIYRNKVIRLSGKGTLLYVHSTTYEEEFDRLFSPLNKTFTVRLQDIDTILVSPAPFLYDPGILVPASYDILRLRSFTGNINSRAVTSVSFLEENQDEGDWIMATMTTDQSRIVAPGGIIMTKETCLLNPKSCLWNYETRLSFDGTRKLCSTITSSRNLECTITPELPSTFKRYQTVIVADLETPDVVVDWSGAGPWYIGLTNSNDFDLSLDSNYIEFSVSPASLITSISVLEIRDIAIPSACSPTIVNATTLDTQWIDKFSTRSTHILPGTNVVGAYNLNGQRKVIRGYASANSGEMYKAGFSRPVRVETMKPISYEDSKRGLHWDDYRILGSICPDGTSSFLNYSSTQTEVTCTCLMKTSRHDTDCDCSDRFLGKYKCICSSADNTCTCNEGKHDLFELQTNLEVYLNETNGACFLSQYAANEINYVTGTTSTQYEFESLYSSAYLIELRVEPCIDVPVLEGRASLYSDVLVTIPIDYYCNGLGNMTIKANLTDFQQAYDHWVLSGMNVSTNITALFSPGGVSIKPTSVVASSNQAQAENVLWNDMSYWSSQSPDGYPTITLVLPSHKKIHAVFLVLRTVGVYLNANVTIPVEMVLQSSSDGVSYQTIKKIKSDVVNGFLDVYAPLLADTDVIHSVRIRSPYPLSVREFVVFGDEFCDRDDMDLIIDPAANFMSLAIESLEKVLSSIASDVDTKTPCVCVDDCTLNGRKVLVTDKCFDEIYKPKNIQWTLLETLTKDDVLQELNMGINVSLTKPNYFFVNETLAIWSFNDPPPGLEYVGNCSANTICVVNGNTSILIRDSSSSEIYHDIFYDAEGELMLAKYNYTTAVERKEVCPAGFQCSECGTNIRKSPRAKGSKCTLSDFEKKVYEDYKNRSDHITGNTALIDDYLKTGYVQVQIRSIKFSRTVVFVNRTSCNDCFPFSPCPDGTCRETCDGIRWNNIGNGCTRISTDLSEYTCACKPGYSGTDCSLEFCLPGDPETGKIPAEKWCSCGGDPPLKALPPFSRVLPKRGCYTENELDQIDSDTGKIHHEYAPYGIPLLWCYKEGGRTLWSNCPFYKKGPFGQKISFKDSVIYTETVDSEGRRILNITGYVKFETAVEGVYETYDWKRPNGKTSKLAYRDFPYRCPNSYSCVATKKDCYNDFYINPSCGGSTGAKCRIDGTCDCPVESKTFLYTKEWTDVAKIPYSAENPTIWGREYKPIKNHCKAKNCSDPGVNCLAPLGCYTGTKEYDFKDKHVSCPETSTHAGKCATDLAACDRGEVTEAGVCSFNGIPRIIDYTSGEERCHCGKPKGKLVDVATRGSELEIVELEPNGWGGYFCQTYYCSTDLTGMYWSYADPRTLAPYVDDELVRLPGKWIGGKCDQHLGPNPDDARLWHNCCPGLTRLSRCGKVMCRIANIPTCVPIEDCKGSARTPMIENCNGKGIARADGSCVCEYDKTTGVGYGPGPDGLGCFTKLYCPVAKNGQVCNSGLADSRYWTRFPKIDGFEDQIPALALRQGINPTSENLVKIIFGELENRKELTKNAMVQIALQVASNYAGANSARCVMFANETCDAPVGMLPYCDKVEAVGKYMQSFKIGFQIFPINTSSILFDYKYQYENSGGFSQPSLGDDFLQVSSVSMQFSRAVTVTGIRMFAKTDGLTNFTFVRDDGVSDACSSFSLEQMSQYAWVEPNGRSNNIHYCEQLWEGYDFENERGWAINCQGNRAKPECYNFIDNLCRQFVGYVIVEASSLQVYKGCDYKRCCVPVTPEPTPTNNLTLKFSLTVNLQEVVLFGYYSTVEPLSEALKNELNFLQKRSFGDDQCVHYPYISSLFGEDGNYYRPVDYSTYRSEYNSLNESLGLSACTESGGVLATQRTTQEDSNYQARTYGEGCYRGRTTTGDDIGCLIGAKDRNDALVPKLDDFIEPTCSTWGCYHCWDGTTNCKPVMYIDFLKAGDVVDYVSTGDNGSQWQQRWLNGTMSWPDYAETLSRKEEIQLAMVAEIDQTKQIGINSSMLPDERMIFFFETTRPHVSWRPVRFHWWPKDRYDTTNGFGGIGAIINIHNWAYWRSSFPYNFIFENKSGTMHTQDPEPETRFQVKPSRLSSDDKYKQTKRKNIQHEYWADNTTCTVTFYSRANCGQWADMQRGYNIKSKHVVVITPANDYADLFVNLLEQNRKFDRCAVPRVPADLFPWIWKCYEKQIVQGNVITSAGYSNYDSSQCEDYGWPLETYRSISVNGPCGVEVKATVFGTGTELKRVFTEDYPGPLAGGVNDRSTNDNGGSNKYQWAYFRTTYNTLHNHCHVFPIGCAPECTDGSAWCRSFSGTNIFDQGHGWPEMRTGRQYPEPSADPNDPVIAAKTDSNYDFRIKTSIKIFPFFSNYKVKQSIRTNVAQYATPTRDDFTLGALDHPFMCSRVDIFTTKGFTATINPTSTVAGLTNAGFINKTMINYGPNGMYMFNSSVLPYVTLQEASNEALDPTRNMLVSCDAVRPMVQCPSCIKEQPTPKWEWDQRYLNPLEASFKVEVNKIRQRLYTVSPEPIKPQMFLTALPTIIPTVCRVRFATSFPFYQVVCSDGNPVDDIRKEYHPMTSWQADRPRIFARQLAILRISDYRKKFYYDRCMQVVRNLESGGNEFMFDTAICEKPTYNVLCQRQYIKYAVVAGNQCDKCGLSEGAGNVLRPGMTVFDAFPLVDAEAYPVENNFYVRWFAGALDTLLTQEYIDYDPIYNFIRYSLNESLVFGFPKARSLLDSSFSDRPGKVSPGAIADPNTGVDFDWKRTYPIECGEECSPITGLCGYLLVQSRFLCNPNATQFNATLIPDAEYPRALLPITEDEPIFTKRCGYIVDLTTYAEFDDDGPISPIVVRFQIVEKVRSSHVKLKLTRSFSSWYNTYKVLDYTFTSGTTLTGAFECSRFNCSIVVWVSSSSVFGGVPSDKTEIGEVFSSPFTLRMTDLGNLTFKNLGVDFKGMQRGDTVKLYTFLATDSVTIGECKRNLKRDIHELPSAIYVTNPENTCVFDAGVDLGATCKCRNPAYDGPSCESPSFISKAHNKAVCGTYGLAGDFPNADALGVYYVGEKAYCNCLDMGRALQSYLDNTLQYNYRFVYISDRLFFESEYVAVTGTNIPSELLSPYSYVQTLRGLSANSLSLLSWSDGDSVKEYISEFGSVGVITDLGRTSDGDFNWRTRALDFVLCENDVCLQTLSNPCVDKGSFLCQAIQFNNLAFNMSGNAWTDGLIGGVTQSAGTKQFTLRQPSVRGITIDIKLLGSPSVSSVTITGAVTVGGCDRVGVTYVWNCYSYPDLDEPVSGVTRVDVVFGSSQTIYEVFIYEQEDLNRFYDYFI